MNMTLDEVKVGAKREDFRAGVQMRMLMPRLSVRVTRYVLAYTKLMPDQITMLSFAVGICAVACFASTTPWIVFAGLLGFHLHVLLDYVDGEVARCRGIASVAGAYFDLMTDRVTFPLFIFCSGLGVYRMTGDPSALIVAFIATFGLFLDKEAVDCWYRANSGVAAEAEVEDRYVEAPTRSGMRRLRGQLSLLAVMVRGMTAFLTYTAAAAFFDGSAATSMLASSRGLVLCAFAALMPIGAIVRFLYVYQRGAIPRRQQLL